MERRIYKVLFYERVSRIHEEQDESQQLMNYAQKFDVGNPFDIDSEFKPGVSAVDFLKQFGSK